MRELERREGRIKEGSGEREWNRSGAGRNGDNGENRGKEGESKITDTIETKAYRPGPDILGKHHPQISSASEPSKLSLQVTGWCVGLMGFLAFFRCDTRIQGSTPWSLVPQGLVNRT